MMLVLQMLATDMRYQLQLVAALCNNAQRCSRRKGVN